MLADFALGSILAQQFAEQFEDTRLVGIAGVEFRQPVADVTTA